jgi:hypothetical protein
VDSTLPYVTAALLCEKVLQEKDNSISVIRIADRVQYKLPEHGIPVGMKPAVQLSGFIGIKSGPVTGTHQIKLTVERPNGDRKEIVTYPVDFLGKDHGQNLVLNFVLNADQDGLYWFDVIFNEIVLTRIPLLVMPLPEETPADSKS